MKETLQSEAEQHDTLQRPHHEQQKRAIRRVGLLDRVALHVGVALVAWSRRPRAVQIHECRADQLQQQRDTLVRELAAERMYYLGPAQR